MNRPIIGVLPLVDKQRESLWMLPGYFGGIEQAGGLPVMLPLTAGAENLEQIADTFGGFLFTGGQDVSPAVYGADASPLCGECSAERDAMELALLRLVLERGKPVLGICRGIQFINAALGGTLYQHLPAEFPSCTEHHQAPPYDKPIHTIKLTPGAPLERLLGCGTLAVNSYHHQAVKALAPPLRPMAISEDGLIEAVYLPDKPFVWAVQWHPEFSYKTDEASRRIFSAFIKACG